MVLSATLGNSRKSILHYLVNTLDIFDKDRFSMLFLSLQSVGSNIFGFARSIADLELIMSIHMQAKSRLFFLKNI